MKKLLLLLLISILELSCTQKNNREEVKEINESLPLQQDTLTKVVSEQQPESNYWFNPEYDGRSLLKRGITNPEEFIANQLRKKSDLIPLEAVMGGTMQFGKVQLLSNEWLIADYSDGHIEGRAIYKYELQTNGQLVFELLTSSGNQ